jgi:hypothetical protein
MTGFIGQDLYSGVLLHAEVAIGRCSRHVAVDQRQKFTRYWNSSRRAYFFASSSSTIPDRDNRPDRRGLQPLAHPSSKRV